MDNHTYFVGFRPNNRAERPFWPLVAQAAPGKDKLWGFLGPSNAAIDVPADRSQDESGPVADLWTHSAAGSNTLYLKFRNKYLVGDT